MIDKIPVQIQLFNFSTITVTLTTKDTRQKNDPVPVEIVEEWQEVESQFAPAFFLTERQDVCIHDGCWVVESWTAHHRSAHIPASQ